MAVLETNDWDDSVTSCLCVRKEGRENGQKIAVLSSGGREVDGLENFHAMLVRARCVGGDGPNRGGAYACGRRESIANSAVDRQGVIRYHPAVPWKIGREKRKQHGCVGNK